MVERSHSLKSGFQFIPSAKTIKGIDRLALSHSKGYNGKGHSFCGSSGGTTCIMNTVAARLRRFSWVKIQTGWGVLKDELGTPSGAGRVTVAAFLDEVQFGFKHCK